MLNTRFSQRLLTLRRDENPGPQKHAQHPPLCRKEVVQTFKKVKNKKKNLSDNTKTRNQKREKESEDPDWYGSPYNYSDYPTSEKTKAKKKQWENY